MPIGTTAAIIGAAALGAGSSMLASNKAASTQSKAAQAGLNAEQQMYNQSREDLSPWRLAGQNALSEYAGQVGVPGYRAQTSFQKSPGYDFRLQEGLKAARSGLGARGMLRSGTRFKALNEYGQNIASEEYGNWMNRLSQLSGIGQTTATTQAGQNLASAGNRADLLGQQGAARASGYVGQANAGTSALNNLAGFGQSQGWFNKTPFAFGGYGG